MQYFKSGKLRLVALFFVYWERNYTALCFTGGKGQALSLGFLTASILELGSWFALGSIKN